MSNGVPIRTNIASQNDDHSLSLWAVYSFCNYLIDCNLSLNKYPTDAKLFTGEYDEPIPGGFRTWIF